MGGLGSSILRCGKYSKVKVKVTVKFKVKVMDIYIYIYIYVYSVTTLTVRHQPTYLPTNIPTYLPKLLSSESRSNLSLITHHSSLIITVHNDTDETTDKKTR